MSDSRLLAAVFWTFVDPMLKRLWMVSLVCLPLLVFVPATRENANVLILAAVLVAAGWTLLDARNNVRFKEDPHYDD